MPPPPLMLVPGLLCDDAVWESQRAALSHQTEVIVVRHGTADTLGRMAEQALDLAPPRFALAGHSMGGRVALEILARAPDQVTRLALLDTGYQGFPTGSTAERERAGRMRLLELARESGMRAAAAAWARDMVHPARRSDAALMDAIHDMIARSTPEIFAAQIAALLARPDRTALLGKIAVPTLVLCGHEDTWAPLGQHRALAALIARSVLVAIPLCGHMSPMERPREVDDALLAWLRDEPQPLAIPVARQDFT